VRASVIIPTYNRAKILIKCVDALMEQTFDDYEVIVVDDASTDDTEEQIRRYPVRYVRLEERSGPAHARNVGIELAEGELIIFVDSDVIVAPEFVQDHVEIHEERGDIILQGMVYHVRELPRRPSFRYLIPNGICWHVFITQNASVKKRWLLEVGGFDEQLGAFMGYHDLDLGLRLQELGLPMVHAFRRCRAYHVDGPPMELDEFIRKSYERGKTAYAFVRRFGRRGERIAHTRKALIISHVLKTERWVEGRGVRRVMAEFACVSPIYQLLKGIIRYHYRAKGILEAMDLWGEQNMLNLSAIRGKYESGSGSGSSWVRN